MSGVLRKSGGKLSDDEARRQTIERPGFSAPGLTLGSQYVSPVHASSLLAACCFCFWSLATPSDQALSQSDRVYYPDTFGWTLYNIQTVF